MKSNATLTRRQMLKLTVAMTALAGCGRVIGNDAIAEQARSTSTATLSATSAATAVATRAAQPTTAPASTSARSQAWLAANRLTFGPRPGDLDHIAQIGIDAFIEEQLGMAVSVDANNTKLANLDAQFPTLSMKPGDLVEQVQLDKAMNKQMVIGDLQGMTITRAIYSQRQLYEVMVDFWSNHFNIHAAKNTCYALKPTDDRDVIRPHALGNFRDLLHASSKSAAMMIYLDNQANRKQAPDENYARELMELHTVSVDGGYAQKDVQELARVLTGWNVVNPRNMGMGKDSGQGEPGTFYFNSRIHDDGAAQVLGLDIPAGAGMRSGEGVLDMLAARPSTAMFIATKLARRFIADEPPASIVQTTAAAFTKSNGDIKATLGALLHSDEFKQSFGQKLKRPFEFAVSALRATNADVIMQRQLMQAINKLGQPLFMWPFPNGYPDVKHEWTSTNLILNRWNFATALMTNTLKGAKVDVTSFGAGQGDVIDALSIQLLGAALPSSAKAAMKPFANRPAVLAALMLASPLFQERG